MYKKRLSNLSLGEQATVIFFAGLEDRHIRKLLAFGVMPGAVVEVLQLSPTFVIRFEHTQLALDHEIAFHIYVVKK
jgi:Fe2+ transport system protein FeoA